MARNTLPTNASQLIGLGNSMHAGLDKYGTELGITQITAPDFEEELNTFIDASGKFNAARSARQDFSNIFKAAETAVAEWLLITRNILAGRFGNRWSTMWAQAGFINPSTAIPRRIEERLGLALRLANFFTLNPTYEVASMQVTAAKATALRTAAVAAQEALTTAEVDLKTRGDVYEVAFIVLTDTMRALIKILAATLNREDPRWLAFGLEMPATNTTPGKPVNVTAHLDDLGNIIVQCDGVPLATRYRWRMLIIGVETNYRLVARSTEPLGIIKGVIPGQRAQIIVQAVNNNMQGVASDPIVFQVKLNIPVEPASAEPLSLPVNEEAIAAATGDSTRSRVSSNRLPTLT